MAQMVIYFVIVQQNELNGMQVCVMFYIFLSLINTGTSKAGSKRKRNIK